MYIVKSVTIPPGTTKDEPKRITFPHPWGFVLSVRILWRYGSGNLCGCRILAPNRQIYPYNYGEWFYSQVDPVGFSDMLPLIADPLLLTIEGYNEDESFAHTVVVHLDIGRDRILKPPIWTGESGLVP